ncbi:MAG: protoheme IX farnesyltransferase [Verrucomicrobia bacterium Tous-C9LFEB]|nr:MAG: protoheme IX farnesyltransferase [Verrucomicrobia bacterium Tous-C9LFEB]
MKTVAAESMGAEGVSWRALASDFSELVKARLTLLVLLTTLAGFFLGSEDFFNGEKLFHTLLGTAILAGAASALNQYLERGADARMKRTRNRPLAAGRLAADEVVVLAVAAAIMSTLYLAALVNVLAAAIGAATLLIYVLVYTPLKKQTPLNTLVGAIPGALPPVLGWVAARGSLTVESVELFAVLFLWQMPHFLAIAWLYREDYAAGGFKMLSLNDVGGRHTATHSFLYAMMLVPVSLLAAFWLRHGIAYGLGAALCSGAFAWLAWRFFQQSDNQRARHLFWGSLLYLPLILGLMTLAA